MASQSPITLKTYIPDKNFKAFQDMALAHGWKASEGFVLRVAGGYPFMMKGTTISGWLVLSVIVATYSTEPGPIVDALRLNLPDKARIVDHESEIPGFTVAFTDSLESPTYLSDLEAVLQQIAAALYSWGIQPPTTCPVCQGGYVDAFAWHGGAYSPVHRACIEAEYRNQVNNLTAKQAKSSYLLGAVGALVGTLIGAIPTILSIVLLQRIVVLLCALVPLAGGLGYRLFRGKLTWAATAIILVFSLLQGFVIEIAAVYAAIVDFYGFWPSVFEVIPFYFEILNGEMLGSLLMTLLFIGIGVVISLPFITRTARKDIDEAAGKLDTIVDMR